MTFYTDDRFVVFRNTLFRIFLNLDRSVEQMEHDKEAPSFQKKSRDTAYMPAAKTDS